MMLLSMFSYIFYNWIRERKKFGSSQNIWNWRDNSSCESREVHWRQRDVVPEWFLTKFCIVRLIGGPGALESCTTHAKFPFVKWMSSLCGWCYAGLGQVRGVATVVDGGRAGGTFQKECVIFGFFFFEFILKYILLAVCIGVEQIGEGIMLWMKGWIVYSWITKWGRGRKWVDLLVWAEGEVFVWVNVLFVINECQWALSTVHPQHHTYPLRIG